VTRRRAFVGLCAAAFVAAGLMVMDVNPAVPQTVALTALRSSRDPGLDPNSGAWDDAPQVEIPLTAQQVTYPFGGGTVAGVAVKALSHHRTLYLRVEWADDTYNAETNSVTKFADGVAVEFPATAKSSVPSVCMGQADGGVNVWQWRADRQQPATVWPKGVYPNGYVDEYPLRGELAYPALDVGNPVARTHRAAQDLVAQGFGTLAPSSVQTVAAHGVYDESASHGTWSVVFRRPFAKPGSGQPGFAVRDKLDVAFAVWQGQEDERNGKKSVSQFGQLVLSSNSEPSSPWTGWWFVAIPVVALVLFGLWRFARWVGAPKPAAPTP